MSSETINLLVGTLNDLDSKLRQCDSEVRRLGDLRVDLKGTTAGLQTAGKELQGVASALREGAMTMRELDMSATLKRLAEIEKILDARSRELETAIDREIAELGDSLKHVVQQQLAALPERIGPPIGTALDQQLKTTKDAIARINADAKARGDELSAEFEAKIGTLSRTIESHTGTMAQAVERLQSLFSAAQQSQSSTIMRALAEAEARDASAGERLERQLGARLDRLAGKITMALAVASIAAILSAVTIFV
jgi:hypothetical protein